MIAVQPGAAARAMALMGKTGANDTRRGRAVEEPDAGEEPTGRVAFSCVEAVAPLGVLARVPCTATLEPISIGAQSDRGDAGATSDGGDAGDEEKGRTEVDAADGKVAIDAPPGKYRVTASLEPDYVGAHFDVEVAEGATAWGPREGAVVLTRIVDTHGYLAADATPRAFGEADVRVKAARWLADEAARGGDALDVWSTDDATVREHALSAFLARLAAKAPVTPVASGNARTYVRMDDAGQVAPWDAKRELDLARGVRERRDVVLSNGPFLRVTANLAPIGGVARAAGRTHDVEVVVHVECAPGVSVERLALRRALDAAVEVRPITLHATATARVADATFHLRAPRDDVFVVTAESPTPAYAMTGPLWIDADGDGESLGRKVDDIAPAVRDKKKTP